ncbi:SubName: Full=Uncharacterized protein {ECO:0000313/EMBL:CCA71117.1} [Serendipita indica DSM 11827]|uniref:Uncharacterized protein n=1 Tax=Serendipita indica (strain DSM 11827) TaxID=1109443 RepID=G4TIG8_SERID|nr:SubName: Full=Uncharacterized protein {ECO:0000313/EMBL:CCA71117.1} [Serendipita indica DSM 11827]CCA71117.1 hypothetical protein PIIN_05052 [Serendipita indica DSM 11827]
MAQDFRRVSTLVLLPPLLVISYISAFGVVGFVGFHLWLEHVAMAGSEATPDGWELEQEDWTGGIEKGGTDPSLGMPVRIALRSAWFFQHWADNNAKGGNSPSASALTMLFGRPERGLELAEEYIRWAIGYLVAAKKTVPPALLQRHVDVLESIGTESAMMDAWKETVFLYSTSSPGSLERAKLIFKMGNLMARNNNPDKAVEFWKEALKIRDMDEESLITAELTPAEQRHVVDVYLQLSALYSVRKEFQKALEPQISGMILADRFLHKQAEVSPAHELHRLYLGQRGSMFLIHSAMAQFAPSSDIPSALRFLDNAIRYETKVAKELCTGNYQTPTNPAFNEPTSDEDASSLIITIPPSEPSTLLSVHPLYANIKILSKPSATMLRDARRAIVQARLLQGSILETLESPAANKVAASAYREALQWAGMTVERGKSLGIPEAEVMDLQRRIESLQKLIELDS